MQDALFGDDAVSDPTWSVRDLSRAIGAVLDQAFPGEIWVRGEIRDLPPPGDARRNRPHLYFDLIEPGPPGQRPAATLPVVLWATDRKRVNTELRRSGIRVSAMDSGVDVRIRGRLRWWAPGGRPQLQMTGIDPEYTLGRLAADREAVLAALAAEGLLDRNGRLDLPVMPERVAVVTSVGAAAHADVLRVMEAAGLAHLLIDIDARTQGPGALDTIPAALAAAVTAGADMILLVRGGGSRVELASFDTEVIARAVALCGVPVVTGIGHQIDESVADRVAHTACPTPTAAAATVVALVAEARDHTEGLWAAIAAGAERTLTRRRTHLSATARHTAALTVGALRTGDAAVTAASRRVRRAAPAVLISADSALDAAGGSVTRTARRRITQAEATLATAGRRIGRSPGPTLERRARDLAGLEARVRAADPARALARGWSITYRDDGSVVRSTTDVAPGDALVTVVADGAIHVRVAPDEGGSPDA